VITDRFQLESSRGGVATRATEAGLPKVQSAFPFREEMTMAATIYPEASPEIARQRRDLAPEIQAAFEALGRQVFVDGALSAKTKQLIAVAVAHVTQCPYCIRGHTKAARRAGATPQELMEAVWVAAEMRAGGAYAHATIMIAALSEETHP
jgi:AhpD family alkylhydroperoxidase